MAAESKKVSVMSLSMYSEGGGVPEGDYVWSDIVFANHTGFGEQKYAARLGAVITLQSLTNPTAKPFKKFYSMGESAQKSFAPDPDTNGRSLVSIPQAKDKTLSAKSSWAILLQSLYQSGLPAEIVDDSVEPIIGIHVHMQDQPTPESWSDRGASTAEKTSDDVKIPKTISVVSLIHEDGKPWEGTGGVTKAAAATVKAAVKPNGAVKATPKAVVKATPAPEPEPEVEAADDDLTSLASDIATTILSSKNAANGCKRMYLKTQVFTKLKASHGEDTAQAVSSSHFETDELINDIIKPLGYEVSGVDIIISTE